MSHPYLERPLRTEAQAKFDIALDAFDRAAAVLRSGPCDTDALLRFAAAHREMDERARELVVADASMRLPSRANPEDQEARRA